MLVEITPYSPGFIGGGNLGVVEERLAEAIGDVGPALERIEVKMLLTSLPLAPRSHAVDDVSAEEFDALLKAIAPDAHGWGSPEWIVPHEKHRARGGVLMFRRSAATVFITVLSDLAEHDVHASESASEEDVATALAEIAKGLEPLRRRVKAHDALDVDGILTRIGEAAVGGTS